MLGGSEEGRLHHAHSHNLNYAEDRLNFFNERKEEYTTLLSTLERLSSEAKQEIMVPFSKHAFIPGKLVHTGEVMVFLGDGYFVNRTTAQAIDIAKRRIEAIAKDIARCETSASDTRSRMDFAAELSMEDEGNIQEDLTEADLARTRSKARVPGKGVPLPRPAFSEEELRKMREEEEEEEPKEEEEEEEGSSDESSEVDETIITFSHSDCLPSHTEHLTPASVIDNLLNHEPSLKEQTQQKRVSFEGQAEQGHTTEQTDISTPPITRDITESCQMLEQPIIDLPHSHMTSENQSQPRRVSRFKASRTKMS